GPIGAVAGAVVGGIAGGLAGKGIAEQIDPTAEDAYWRKEYPSRDYYDENLSYDEVAPAYRHGWESRANYKDQTWAQVEPELQKSWESTPSSPQLAWAKARRASRDAWDRVERTERPDDHQG
nr:hypothetical protein [Pirellulales bacterium]